jgi:NADPH-dependent curcumin reductase CurA
LVIGTVASYSTEKGIQGDKVDTLQLLASSRTVAGFFMPAYNHLFKEHMQSMIGALLSGKLKVEIDTAGLAGLGNVVEYLHKGKNKGKLVIPLLKSASKL